MTDTARHDTWALGAGYEQYVGRWSRLVAADFLKWIAIPPGKSWLDVGCGTGALSQCILATCAPAKVLGVDQSDGFVAHTSAHVTDSRAEFRIGDARALPVDDATFDAVVSGLVRAHTRPAESRRGNAARRAAGRDDRGLCLGLCRRDAADPQVLGCRDRAQSQGARA